MSIEVLHFYFQLELIVDFLFLNLAVQLVQNFSRNYSPDHNVLIPNLHFTVEVRVKAEGQTEGQIEERTENYI